MFHLFAFTFFDIKLSCKKVWFAHNIPVQQNFTNFIKIFVEKNESISSKHGSFRMKMVFKFNRKNYLNKIIIFLRLTVLVLAEYNETLLRESNFILFCIFNHFKYINHHLLYFLSVNCDLTKEKLVTSTI